ncbi:MAG: WG repeat-containing protein [Erysipelotrichaceae bacterium]
MKLLFKTECKELTIYNTDKLIFKADDKFLDTNGKEVSVKDIDYCVALEVEQQPDRKEICGTSKYLMPESVIPSEVRVEDVCGLFGYFDENGEEAIKAQYKCAHEFAYGLASVSYDYAENYGFINEKGETVIPMIYDYADEFNKYGITVVRKDNGSCVPIDTEGKELFVPDDIDLCPYNYNPFRFVEFEYPRSSHKRSTGCYDTKTREYIYDAEPEDICCVRNGMDIVIKRNGRVKEVYKL